MPLSICCSVLERYAQTVERVEHFGIDLVQTLRTLLFARRRIVAYGLKVDLRHLEMSPCRRRQREPVAESLQPEVKQPLRLTFLGRDQSHHILAETSRNYICVDGRMEAILIVVGTIGYFIEYIVVVVLFHKAVYSLIFI